LALEFVCSLINFLVITHPSCLNSRHPSSSSISNIFVPFLHFLFNVWFIMQKDPNQKKECSSLHSTSTKKCLYWRMNFQWRKEIIVSQYMERQTFSYTKIHQFSMAHCSWFSLPNSYCRTGHQVLCRNGNLVRVFYYNFKYRDGVAFNKVKGIYIIPDNYI